MHTNHDHICFRKRWEIDQELASMLGECKGLIQAISDTPILPQYHQQLMLVSMRKGAQATTAIEGNTLSLVEIEKIGSVGHAPKPSKEYQEKEVSNILSAFSFIMGELVFKNNIEYISESLLLQLHELVGRDVGESFQADPGTFRRRNVYVGDYRAPNFSEVPKYVHDLCEWLKSEFHFGAAQSITEAIVQAIVAHMYIAWIHPFLDGNGRTARLLEFYILMRAGMPNIASHILSNHYNDTRAMYYAKIGQATRSNDLSEFLRYAVEGLLDGLREVLDTVQVSALQIAWRSYIFEQFNSLRSRHTAQLSSLHRRRRELVLNWQPGRACSGFQDASQEVLLLYRQVSERTFIRDLEALEDMNLLVRTPENKLIPNVMLLRVRMAIHLESMV